MPQQLGHSYVSGDLNSRVPFPGEIVSGETFSAVVVGGRVIAIGGQFRSVLSKVGYFSLCLIWSNYDAVFAVAYLWHNHQCRPDVLGFQQPRPG